MDSSKKKNNHKQGFVFFGSENQFLQLNNRNIFFQAIVGFHEIGYQIAYKFSN